MADASGASRISQHSEPAALNLGTGVQQLANAVDQLAQNMNKWGATAWVAALGAVTVLVALATQVGAVVDGSSGLRPGEFIAALAAGLLMVSIGVGFRFYAYAVAQRATRETAQLRERTEALEAMQQTVRTEARLAGEQAAMQALQPGGGELKP